MSLLDFMQDMLPESWFDNIRVNYGDTLTDEMISQSVQTSCEFFNMPMPELVAEYETTGVFPLDNSTVMDDILVFSREQLVNMGITQQDGLDLVMTHEQGHRALQSLNLDFDSHKEELCCDFMAGVRAGLNGMDFYQMESPLADTIASDTHPGGADRIEAIEAGVKFAKEYYEVNNVAPAFSDCLDYFIENAGGEGNITPEQINLRPDDKITFRGGETAGSVGFVDGNNVTFRGDETAGSAGFVDSDNISFRGDSGETAGSAGFVDSNNVSFRGGETAGSAGFVDNDVDEKDPSFKGYTQSEINSRIRKAQHEMSQQESNMRHRVHMMKSKARMNEPYSYEEYQYNQARRAYNEAASELNKWRNMKPDK